jgi:FKBP-type peptidyl-prolyl cis-trans isomerase
MFSRFCLITGLCFTLSASGYAQTPHLGSHLEKLSYALGMRFGQQMMKQGMTKLDPAAVALGIQDMMGGVPPRVNRDQVEAAQAAVLEDMKREARDQSKKNLEDGLSFLEGNKSREGIVTLPSGVQYRIIKAGDGKQPKTTDQVVVHYRGTLLTGQEFDSSYARGEPLTFGLDRVIPGWTQVVSSIKAGTKVETWIPPKHGYGERGSPPTIPPNSTLYFEIELLEVK